MNPPKSPESGFPVVLTTANLPANVGQVVGVSLVTEPVVEGNLYTKREPSIDGTIFLVRNGLLEPSGFVLDTGAKGYLNDVRRLTVKKCAEAIAA